jgi:hypothetical protein
MRSNVILNEVRRATCREGTPRGCFQDALVAFAETVGVE